MENNEIIDLLQNMGWRQNDRLEKVDIMKQIQDEGFTIFEPVVDFLFKFIDTKIYFFNKRNGLVNDDINFNFEEASHLEPPERICGTYSDRVGKPLCLIGSVYRNYMVLVMASDGYVYGCYDNYLCRIATSGLGAIEAIIKDYEFEDVP